MRVKGVSPVEYAPEAKLPFDERVGEAMLDMEKTAPAQGPFLH